MGVIKENFNYNLKSLLDDNAKKILLTAYIALTTEPKTNDFIKNYELQIEYNTGIKIAKIIGYTQSKSGNLLNEKEKTFFVSCGKVCFNVDTVDAIILSELTMIQTNFSIF